MSVAFNLHLMCKVLFYMMIVDDDYDASGMGMHVCVLRGMFASGWFSAGIPK